VVSSRTGPSAVCTGTGSRKPSSELCNPARAAALTSSMDGRRTTSARPREGTRAGGALAFFCLPARCRWTLRRANLARRASSSSSSSSSPPSSASQTSASSDVPRQGQRIGRRLPDALHVELRPPRLPASRRHPASLPASRRLPDVPRQGQRIGRRPPDALHVRLRPASSRRPLPDF